MTRPDRVIEHWEDVQVTALPPGWRNVYKHDDGTVTATDCPALLLQEHRADERIWDVPADGAPHAIRTKRDPLEPPYETRVVFADDGGGWLEPVDIVSNYVGTVGPSGDPNAFASDGGS